MLGVSLHGVGEDVTMREEECIGECHVASSYRGEVGTRGTTWRKGSGAGARGQQS